MKILPNCCWKRLAKKEKETGKKKRSFAQTVLYLD